MTVPVEFDDERDPSESLETGWREASLGFPVPYTSGLSSLGEMLGSCTISSDNRLVSLSKPSSIARKSVPASGPCPGPCVGVLKLSLVSAFPLRSCEIDVAVSNTFSISSPVSL